MLFGRFSFSVFVVLQSTRLARLCDRQSIFYSMFLNYRQLDVIQSGSIIIIIFIFHEGKFTMIYTLILLFMGLLRLEHVSSWMVISTSFKPGAVWSVASGDFGILQWMT